MNLLGGNIYGNIDVNAGRPDQRRSGNDLLRRHHQPRVHAGHTGVAVVTAADLDTGLSAGRPQHRQWRQPRAPGTAHPAAIRACTTVRPMRSSTRSTSAPTGRSPTSSEPAATADPAGRHLPAGVRRHGQPTGTLVADIRPANGLFADSYFWDNVIDANTRDGDLRPVRDRRTATAARCCSAR